MYTPIALLYSERGMFRGMRFFQWFERGEEPVKLVSDRCLRKAIVREEVSIVQSRVVELSVEDILSCEEKFFTYYGWSKVLELHSRKYISRVLQDGTVLEDTVLILYKMRNFEVLVVDSSGKYRVIDYRKLVKLGSKAGIMIVDKPSSEPLIVDNSINYATNAFKSWLNSLISQCSFVNMPVTYYDKTGLIECEPEVSGTVVIPEGIDCVSLDGSIGVTELSLPKECAFLGSNNDTLRKLKASDVAYMFICNVSCPLLELSLPKRIERREYCKSSFALRATDIPDYITSIDESDYDIEEYNEIVVIGRNSLKSVTMVCAGKTPTLNIVHSEHLRNISVVHSKVGNLAREVDVNLGVVSEFLGIECFAPVEILVVKLDKVGTGILHIKRLHDACNVIVRLVVPFHGWELSKDKRLAVIADSGVSVMLASTDLGGKVPLWRNKDARFASYVQVASEDEAIHKARVFEACQAFSGVRIIEVNKER